MRLGIFSVVSCLLLSGICFAQDHVPNYGQDYVPAYSEGDPDIDLVQDNNFEDNITSEKAVSEPKQPVYYYNYGFGGFYYTVNTPINKDTNIKTTEYSESSPKHACSPVDGLPDKLKEEESEAIENDGSDLSVIKLPDDSAVDDVADTIPEFKEKENNESDSGQLKCVNQLQSIAPVNTANTCYNNSCPNGVCPIQPQSCPNGSCPFQNQCPNGVCPIQPQSCPNGSCPIRNQCPNGVCPTQPQSCPNGTCPIQNQCPNGVCPIQPQSCPNGTCPFRNQCPNGVCPIKNHAQNDLSNAESNAGGESTLQDDGSEKNVDEDGFEYECRILKAINSHRARLGLRMLYWDRDIAVGAKQHSGLINSGYLVHAPGWMECIASINGSPEQVVQLWFNSYAHYQIIMNPNATRCGIGSVGHGHTLRVR